MWFISLAYVALTAALGTAVAQRWSAGYGMAVAGMLLALGALALFLWRREHAGPASVPRYNGHPLNRPALAAVQPSRPRVPRVVKEHPSVGARRDTTNDTTLPWYHPGHPAFLAASHAGSDDSPRCTSSSRSSSGDSYVGSGGSYCGGGDSGGGGGDGGGGGGD